MSKVIRVKLSPESIADAIQELQDYKAELNRKVETLARLLTNTGVDIVRIKVVEMNAIDTGELFGSINGYYDSVGNKGVIQVDSNYAAFVEFGTGIVGATAPHTNAEYLAKAAWKYSTGSHIFETKDGRFGWYYPTDDGGFRFTEGQKARPFMYETALELQRRYAEKVREVFPCD